MRSMIRCATVTLCLSLLVAAGSSFVLPGNHMPNSKHPTLDGPLRKHQSQILFSSDPEEADSIDEPAKEDQQAPVIPDPSMASTPVNGEEEGAPYPINLPSPLLLASSIILAIAGVGKFKRTSGQLSRFSTESLYSYWR